MLKRNLIANYLGQGWSALMGLIFVPVYIRYLGIEAYGLIGVFASLQAWFVLLDMGLAPTLSREMSRFSAGAHTPKSINTLLITLERVYLAVAIVIFIILAAKAPWIANGWLNVIHLDISIVIQALQVTSLVIAFRWMATLYRSAINGLQYMVWLNAFSSIASTLRGAGVILVLAYVSPTIGAFFIFQLVVTAFEVLVLVVRVRKYLPARPVDCGFSWIALKSVWEFAASMMLLTLLSILLTQIDKLMLSKLLTLENFGYFTLATAVSGVVIMITGPICNVALPKLTEAYAREDKGQLEKYYREFTQLLIITTVPASLVISLFSGQLIMLWTHDQITSDAVATILTFWVIGTGLNAIMHMPYYLQIAAGKMKANITFNVAALFFMIPLYFYLVPKFGALGAAYAWIGINASYFLGLAYFVHKSIFNKPMISWYIKDVVWPSTLPIIFVIGLKTSNLSLEKYGFVPQAALLVAIYLVAVFLSLASSDRGSIFLRTALKI